MPPNTLAGAHIQCQYLTTVYSCLSFAHTVRLSMFMCASFTIAIQTWHVGSPARSVSRLVFIIQVATRRTRTAGKVEIPNVDDHVSKLEHMGKETVKKLQDIKGSAVQSGIDINVPDNRIDKGEHSCCQRTRHVREEFILS